MTDKETAHCDCSVIRNSLIPVIPPGLMRQIPLCAGMWSLCVYSTEGLNCCLTSSPVERQISQTACCLYGTINPKTTKSTFDVENQLLPFTVDPSCRLNVLMSGRIQRMGQAGVKGSHGDMANRGRLKKQPKRRFGQEDK